MKSRKKTAKAPTALAKKLRKELKSTPAEPVAKIYKRGKGALPFSEIPNSEADQLLQTIGRRPKTKVDLLDESVEVEVLDTQTPLVGIPRPPRKRPHGNYYDTRNNPRAVAPDITVKAKEEVKQASGGICCQQLQEVNPLAQQLSTAVIAIKQLAASYLERDDNEQVIQLADWLKTLHGLRLRSGGVYIPE
jgi:hypothetical protein